MAKFEVSQEFQLYQAQTAAAFQEAAAAEHSTSLGCDMPIGTTGRAKITGGSASKGKPKVVNNQPQPGKPRIMMEVEVIEPASHAGRKYMVYFDLSHHEKYSTAQKLGDWWDWMCDAGCPQEVRKTGDPNQGFAWCAQEERVFSFIVNAGYLGRGEIKSVPAAGPLPTATSTANLLNQFSPTDPAVPQPQIAAPAPAPAPVAPTPTPQPVAQPAPAATPTPTPTPQGGPAPGSTVTAFGNQFTVVSVEGTTCTLANPTTGAKTPGVPLTAIQQ